MKFSNLSGIPINKPLWRGLAEAMKVGGELPLAVHDELGLHVGKTLRVTVRPQIPRPEGITIAASYTHGHISMYPCPDCTFAFLTEVYLHELFHAWLHETQPELYDSWKHCSLADEFARTGFALLGGYIPKSDLCGGYRFKESGALQALPAFGQFAESLTVRRGRSITRWRASSAASVARRVRRRAASTAVG